MGGPQFRVAGVPVRVELFFVITAVLLGSYARQGVLLIWWVVIVFVSVLVHELGHAMAYKAYGQSPRILLTGIVGLTYGSGPLSSRTRKIVVSLAGPLTQLAVVGLPAYFVRDSSWGLESATRHQVLSDLVFVSVGWALLNLLPVLPLDGGHICEALFGREKTRYISVATAVLGTIYLYSLGYRTWLLLLLGVFSLVEIVQARKGRRNVAFLPDAPITGATSAKPGKEKGKRPKSRRRREGTLRAVPDPPSMPALEPPKLERVRRGADEERVELLAWDALRRSDASGAQRAVNRLPDPERANPFLVASVALATGDVPAAMARFSVAYLSEPNGPSSLVPATLLARSGKAAELASDLLNAGGEGAQAAAGLQSHLHYAGAFEAAAQVGELVYAAGRSSRAQASFETACSWAQAGNADAGLVWLGRAIDAGFTAGALIDGEPELATVRSLPGYAATRAQVSS
ncbi:MAG: hypothetical protein QOJ67_3481 [Acidimicrobiaceae bacterium]